MRIKQVSVKKLFGILNHTIPLKLDERITIIHGSNGVGKTLLLRMINGLFKSNYSVFRSIPFEEFRTDFDDGTTLRVEKKRSA